MFFSINVWVDFWFSISYLSSIASLEDWQCFACDRVLTLYLVMCTWFLAKHDLPLLLLFFLIWFYRWYRRRRRFVRASTYFIIVRFPCFNNVFFFVVVRFLMMSECLPLSECHVHCRTLAFFCKLLLLLLLLISTWYFINLLGHSTVLSTD